MYTPDNPPPIAAYVSAIQALRNQFSDQQVDLLKFQFENPGRAVTSQDVRDHLGYTSIGPANLRYGTLGKRLAKLLPMETAPEDTDRNRHWQALSTGEKPGKHFVWTMRPQLAEALIQTGIVTREMDGLNRVTDIDIHESGHVASEGGRKLIMHLTRERNRVLVAAKKESAESLACEICGFDSLSVYGIAYCEVHHLTPLSDLNEATETTLDDLAIVCANCHRIIHLQSPPLSVAKMRERLRRRSPEN